MVQVPVVAAKPVEDLAVAGPQGQRGQRGGGEVGLCP